MIDLTGEQLPPLFALLHGGGGLPVRGNRKSGFHFRSAFGATASTMETISLMPPPKAVYMPAAAAALPRRRIRRPTPVPQPAEHVQQNERAWASKPEPPLRFGGSARASPRTHALIDASALHRRPTTPRTGPPVLVTASRARSVATAFEPPRRAGTPPRMARTPGHARIAALRQRHAQPRGGAGAPDSEAAALAAVHGTAAAPPAAAAAAVASVAVRLRLPCCDGEVVVGLEIGVLDVKAGGAAAAQRRAPPGIVHFQDAPPAPEAAESAEPEPEPEERDAEPGALLAANRDYFEGLGAYFEDMRERLCEQSAVAIQAHLRGRAARSASRPS